VVTKGKRGHLLTPVLGAPGAVEQGSSHCSNTLPRYHSLLAILPLQSGKDLIAGAVDSLAEQKIERNVCRLMLARRATSVGNDRRRKPPQTV